jgi:hypothetical protein
MPTSEPHYLALAFRLSVLAAFVISGAGQPGTVASICTIGTFTTSSIEGRVFAVIGQHGPLNEATVELRDEGTKRLVTRTTTDEDGRFRLRRVRHGKYRLRVTSFSFVPMEAIIVVPRGVSVKRELPVALGMDIYLACGGGSVEATIVAIPPPQAPNNPSEGVSREKSSLVRSGSGESERRTLRAALLGPSVGA